MTRATANQRIAALREMEVQRVTLTKPNLPKLQSAVQAAQAAQLADATQISDRAAEGKGQIKSVQDRLETLQYEIPDFSRINIHRGSRVEAVVKNITSIARSINSTLEDAGSDQSPIGGVGSLEKNKESGLLKESADVYSEMLAPLWPPPDREVVRVVAGNPLQLMVAVFDVMAPTAACSVSVPELVPV